MSITSSSIRCCGPYGLGVRELELREAAVKVKVGGCEEGRGRGLEGRERGWG